MSTSADSLFPSAWWQPTPFHGSFCRPTYHVCRRFDSILFVMSPFLGFIPFCLAVSNAWNMFHASLWQPIWLHSFKPTILSGCVFFLFQRSHSTMAVLWNQKKTRKEWRQNGWKSNDASFFLYALTSPPFWYIAHKIYPFQTDSKSFPPNKNQTETIRTVRFGSSVTLASDQMIDIWLIPTKVCVRVCVFVENIVRPITIPSCPYYIVVFFLCFVFNLLHQSQY